MPDALSFAEFDGQHVELLPARTVLSLFSAGSGTGGTAGAGGSGAGGVGLNPVDVNALAGQLTGAGGGAGNAGGITNGGPA